LLSSIEGLDDKRRALLLEIYNNAVIDRNNAYALLEVTVKMCESKSSEHSVHAKTMVSYIDRMAKSNEQLLKLAVHLNDIVVGKDDGGGGTPDEMYGEIEKAMKKKTH